MNERIKNEFMSIEVPDMQEKIVSSLHKQEPKLKVNRIRIPVIAVAVILILAVTTAAGGISSMLRIVNGGKYLIVNDEGIAVNPTGFHLAEDVCVKFSEKAIENYTPYITTPPEPAKLYETASKEEMEIFLDMPLYIPETVINNASLYRLWVMGADGVAVSMHLQVVSDKEVFESFDVYLLGSPGVIGTASEPKIYAIDLNDCSAVSTAVAKSRKGGIVGHSLYKEEDAVYHLVVKGKNAAEVLEKAESILAGRK